MEEESIILSFKLLALFFLNFHKLYLRHFDNSLLIIVLGYMTAASRSVIYRQHYPACYSSGSIKDAGQNNNFYKTAYHEKDKKKFQPYCHNVFYFICPIIRMQKRNRKK